MVVPESVTALAEAAAPRGEHSRVRQVRLPAAQNEQLDAVAASEGRRPSAVIRYAVAQYLERVC